MNDAMIFAFVFSFITSLLLAGNKFLLFSRQKVLDKFKEIGVTKIGKIKSNDFLSKCCSK